MPFDNHPRFQEGGAADQGAPKPPPGFAIVPATPPAAALGPAPPPGFQVLGTQENPLIPKTQADVDSAPPGAYIQTPQGLRIKPHPAAAPPEAIDEKSGEPLDFSDLVEPPKGPSIPGVVARGAVHGALPAVGGMAGFGAGAELGAAIGAPLGPLGAGAGALIGGVGGAYLGSEAVGKAQEALIDRLPESVKEVIGQDEVRRAADIKAHPYAAEVGELFVCLMFVDMIAM